LKSEAILTISFLIHQHGNMKGFQKAKQSSLI